MLLMVALTSVIFPGARARAMCPAGARARGAEHRGDSEKKPDVGERGVELNSTLPPVTALFTAGASRIIYGIRASKGFHALCPHIIINRIHACVVADRRRRARVAAAPSDAGRGAHWFLVELDPVEVKPCHLYL